MPSALPKSIKYCIIGAGVHGLSTAWHLAKQLKAKNLGSGNDIVVVDKTGVAAGASGIACGVIRNFYFQPAMGELIQDSVRVWESDPQAFHYHPVGYIAVAGETQADDLETIAGRHEKIGYKARFLRGERQVFDYMQNIFPDWKAKGLTACLHELQGGFAFNKESMQGLASKAREEGVEIHRGVQVTGFDFAADGKTVTAVKTAQGDIACEQVVVAVGPWIKHVWAMLGLSDKVAVKSNGTLHEGLDMWTYWQLQEGEIEYDAEKHLTREGKTAPVMHVDSSEPLISDRTGKLITDKLWGIYFKRDRVGVQGGAVPKNLGTTAEVDPYGTESPYYTVDADFSDYWTAGLAHCLERFEGCSRHYKQAPSGGIGCFTIDSFPVFDLMRPNVYVVADSNHGYKMIGVGKEVARSLLGEHSRILHPFRFARFAEGDLHPRSHGPFPWT